MSEESGRSARSPAGGYGIIRGKGGTGNHTDDSDFTLMNNHEFETWLHAKNRDNEVEYLPVARTSWMSVAESSAAAENLRTKKPQATAAAYRRTILSLAGL